MATKTLAEIEGSAGGVPLGGITQLDPDLGITTEINGQGFLKNGFVTDTFDSNLPSKKSEPFYIYRLVERVTEPVTSMLTGPLHVNRQGTIIYTLIKNGLTYLYRSTDFSFDFNYIGTIDEFAVENIEEADDGTLVAVGTNGQTGSASRIVFYRSVDGGFNWQDRTEFNLGISVSMGALVTNNNGTWIACSRLSTNPRLYYSFDNGENWLQGGTNGFDHIRTLAYGGNDGTGDVWLVVNTYSSVIEVLRGVQLNGQNSIASFSRVAVNGTGQDLHETDSIGTDTSTGKIIVAGGNGAISTDYGQTFTYGDGSGSFPDRCTPVYLGNNEWAGVSTTTIYTSEDNGETWGNKVNGFTTTTPRVPQSPIEGMFLFVTAGKEVILTTSLFKADNNVYYIENTGNPNDYVRYY